MAGNSAEPGRSVASKIIAILQAFTNGGVHSLTEIARLTGLPISTVHRLASELAASGVLERTDDAQYRVGLPLKVIGSRVSQAPTTCEWARRAMEDLSAAVQADVRFGVLDDLEVDFIEKTVAHQTMSMCSAAAALPAHATALGKAILAFSPPGTVDRVIARGLKRYTAYTLTSPDRLRRSLAETRLSCVALSRWELRVGASAVAAPVFGAGGAVVAALEVKVRDPRSELRLVQPALVVAVRSLSRELAMSQSTDRFTDGWQRRIGGHVNGSSLHQLRPNGAVRANHHDLTERKGG